MIRGHNIVSLSEHLGYFNRDNTEGVPASKNRTNKNSRFIHFGEGGRGGFAPFTTTAIGSGIKRFHLYQRSDEVNPRYLMLNSSGDIYDSSGGIILSIPGLTDFSAISLFNRSYITPHNGETGLSGQFIYVYSGSGVARKIAGLAPVNGAPPFAAANGAAGRVTKGRHLISVAYETDTGFITKPGPVVFFNARGRKKINLTNIPVGPGGQGIIYRHILMTKFIKTYDGNPTHYELFFVPGGTILDNVTTSLTIDCLDSELINSADYLLDLIQEVPATVGLTTYQGSMVVFGEFGKEAVARISVSGSPESFNAVDGFVIVSPGDGGGIRNCREYRGNLEFWKANRTLATRTNGDSPSTWTVAQLDGGYGTRTPDGVTAVLDSVSDSKDTLTVCDDSGLLLFYGRYSDKPLTWSVDTEWRTNFSGSSSVVVDSIDKRIFVTGEQAVLMGDFSNGLDPDNIRWSLWTFQDEAFNPIIPINMAATAAQIALALDGKKCVFTLDEASHGDQIGTEIDPDPPTYTDAPIDNDIILPYIEDENNFLIHFAGVRFRLTGAGDLNISYFKTDNVESTPVVKVMSFTPGSDYLSLFNLIDERVSVRFRVNGIGQFIEGIDSIGLMIKPVYKSRLVVV